MLFLLTFGAVVVVMTNCIKLSLFYLIIPIKFMFFFYFLGLQAQPTCLIGTTAKSKLSPSIQKKTKEDYNLFNENLVKFFENRLV